MIPELVFTISGIPSSVGNGDGIEAHRRIISATIVPLPSIEDETPHWVDSDGSDEAAYVS